MAEPLRKIVIVGAGFGGLSAAQALAKAPVEITLIDQQNHHLFQPLLYQVATAALTPSDIAIPIRAVLRKQTNLRVVMDRVCAVQSGTREVLCASGRRIEYDALILATGATHSYFGNEDWADHAPGLKTLQDASRLREKILFAFEQAEIAAVRDPGAARALQSFVVVGAGPTGVEMAGAIAELAGSVMRDFRSLDAADNRVILVEAGPGVLPGFAPRLSQRAERDLKSLGVDVRLNTKVTGITGSVVHTDQGPIETQTAVWAAGVRASPAASWLGLEEGHVIVDETLRPEGYQNIYVIGDTARLIPDGTEAPLPGIAPVAKQMGQFVGRRLAAQAQGAAPPERFTYRDAGALATIGRNRAVADIFGLKVSGFAGWLLWGAAHVYFLIGFRNRIFVVLSWLWSYLTWQRGVRLILQPASQAGEGPPGVTDQVEKSQTVQASTRSN